MLAVGTGSCHRRQIAAPLLVRSLAVHGLGGARAAGCWSVAAGCWLRAADCRLGVAGCWLGFAPSDHALAVISDYCCPTSWTVLACMDVLHARRVNCRTLLRQAGLESCSLLACVLRCFQRTWLRSPLAVRPVVCEGPAVHALRIVGGRGGAASVSTRRSS